MKIPLFSRFQTYHTFHLPALTFSLQVFRFRQQDTNSRTFQFGQRISTRLLTFSSSCSTHTVKYTCNSQIVMSSHAISYIHKYIYILYLELLNKNRKLRIQSLWKWHFSRLKTKIDNWKICHRPILAVYLKDFSVGKDQISNWEFCVLKITPIIWFCIVSTHF